MPTTVWDIGLHLFSMIIPVCVFTPSHELPHLLLLTPSHLDPLPIPLLFHCLQFRGTSTSGFITVMEHGRPPFLLGDVAATSHAYSRKQEEAWPMMIDAVRPAQRHLNIVL